MKKDNASQRITACSSVFKRLLRALAAKKPRETAIVKECEELKHGPDAKAKARIMLALHKHLSKRNRAFLMV